VLPFLYKAIALDPSWTPRFTGSGAWEVSWVAV
jgi:hypothetical protein